MRQRLERLRQKALSLGVPSAEVEWWLGTVRPCAKLETYGDDGPVVGHLGRPLMLPPDAPDLPESLGLIATVDLAALPEAAKHLPLPPDGRLLLFAEAEEMDIPGTALYVPAGTHLEERQQHLSWESELRGELRLVSDFSLADHKGADLLPHVGELGTAVRQVQREDGDFLGRPDLQIGGYAADDWASSDLVMKSRWSEGMAWLLDRPVGSGIPPPPEDLVLLAQWTSRIKDLMGATYYWTIARQDLAARRFDRTYVSQFWNP
ncbi:DUF1963 domain-containing protein [Streptomyces tendae]|uniref:DUF1963 domain-containing protein n=1 Tax=Streptomyces tendae TaxID=1932 RepID=UPI003711D77A